MSGVGDNIDSNRGGWSFGGQVPKFFDSHVEKSVPLYHEGHNLICDVSDFFIKHGSVVYELGCSTGTLMAKLVQHHQHKKSVKFVGLDLEQDMIDAANQKKIDLKIEDGLDFIQSNALNYEFEKSDFIICYYTVQFIQPSERQNLINRLYDALNWGGALILFEKVRGSDARFQDILTSLYIDYKLRKGYTPEDIIGKSQSLKGVMEPFSTQANLDMLKRAGFLDINTIQKYLCFEGFLAIK